MKSEKCSYKTGVFIFCILCSVTLFASSHLFVNEQVTPKWLGMILCAGIIGSIWSIMSRNVFLPAKPVDTILIACFFLVFIREWMTSGSFLIYSGGLLLLFFLVNNIVKICHHHILFGSITVFALVLSLQGILQYSGILPSVFNNVKVTGSYDNAAGFASALACAFPLCFYFFSSKNKYFRYTAIVIAVMTVIALILSGSRAGILAVVAATAVWLFARPKISSRQSKIIAVFVAVILAFVLYFIKKDSADGRLLIWRCTLDMVADKPVLGHGMGAFQAKYMLYQAEYISAHPDSQYARLADNVLHPFNEYLLILCMHGFAGLGFVILMGLWLYHLYRHNRSKEKLTALMGLSALAVFSFFSYPFKYPFTYVMLFLNMAIISENSGVSSYPAFFTQKRNTLFKHIPRIIIFIFSSVLLIYSVILTQTEIKWKRVAYLSTAGQALQALPEYEELYRRLGNNGLFLYNHAVVLHSIGKFERSLAVIGRCTQYFNDFDVQMLLANNFKALGQHAKAERHLNIAAAMCPARFMPLYELEK